MSLINDLHQLRNSPYIEVQFNSNSTHIKQHVPGEIFDLIFSKCNAIESLCSIRRTCRGFYQIIEKMNSENSLGMALFRNFFPKVTPKVSCVDVDKPMPSLTHQLIAILKDYDLQIKKITKKEEEIRAFVLFYKGTASCPGAILIYDQLIADLKVNHRQQEEKILQSECANLSTDEKIDLLKLSIASVFVDLSKKLQNEITQLAGEGYKGEHSSINPRSKLGRILLEKQTSSQPHLEQLILEEKTICNRLFILLGDSKYHDPELKMGLIGSLCNFSKNLKPFFVKFNQPRDFKTVTYSLIAHLIKLKKDLASSVCSKIGPDFDGSDDSLKGWTELSRVLNILKRLKLLRSNFSQETYHKFIQEGQLPFEAIAH
jgi:hypothetical protein